MFGWTIKLKIIQRNDWAYDQHYFQTRDQRHVSKIDRSHHPMPRNDWTNHGTNQEDMMKEVIDNWSNTCSKEMGWNVLSNEKSLLITVYKFCKFIWLRTRTYNIHTYKHKIKDMVGQRYDQRNECTNYRKVHWPHDSGNNRHIIHRFRTHDQTCGWANDIHRIAKAMCTNYQKHWLHDQRNVWANHPTPSNHLSAWMITGAKTFCKWLSNLQIW